MKKITSVISTVIYPFWILYNALYELTNARRELTARINRMGRIRKIVPTSVTSDIKVVKVTDDLLKSVVADR